MKTINITYNSREDLLPAKDKIGIHPADQMLIQVFSGVTDKATIQNLLNDCKDLFPGISVIGSTTTGEIIDSESKENSIVVSISLFEKTKVHSLTIWQNDDLETAGRDAAKYFRQFSPKGLIIFGCGIKDGIVYNNLPCLREIKNRLGKIIIAGGQAGVYDWNDTPVIFSEKGITGEGFVIASLSGDDLHLKTFYNTSWIPFGEKMTITNIYKNTVFEIDEKPIKEIYQHYLGIWNKKNPQEVIAEFPLMNDSRGFLATNPVSNINDNGTIDFLHRFNLGEQVRFSFSDIGLQEEGAAKLNRNLLREKPESAFIYSCASRKHLLGDDIAVELTALKGIPGTSGFFTYGEFYTNEHYDIHLLAQTITVLSISESKPSYNQNNEIDDIKTHATIDKSVRFRVLKALNHFIGVTTKELHDKNLELFELANKDPLTGISNRRHFNDTLVREVKSSNRAGISLSLLILDVDFFKQFNDIYGHIAGDDCLRAIAHVLGKEIGRPSDLAFRYGGEEFGCLLPHTDFKGAMQIAEQIRTDIENIHIPHEGSAVSDSVTVSIGVITFNCSQKSDPALLTNLCDEQLYEAKHTGRNRVAGKEISFFKNTD